VIRLRALLFLAAIASRPLEHVPCLLREGGGSDLRCSLSEPDIGISDDAPSPVHVPASPPHISSVPPLSLSHPSLPPPSYTPRPPPLSLSFLAPPCSPLSPPSLSSPCAHTTYPGDVTHMLVDGFSATGAPPASLELPPPGVGQVGGGMEMKAEDMQGGRGGGGGEVGARKEDGGGGGAPLNCATCFHKVLRSQDFSTPKDQL